MPIIDYEGLGVEPPSGGDIIDERKTYGEWLAEQTAERKADILGGKSRAKIFDKFAAKIGPMEQSAALFVRMVQK